MWEFNLECECPHCGHDNDVCVAFNDQEFDPDGGAAPGMKARCSECMKYFWYDASICFDTNIDAVYSKNPKVSP
jgi:hypothetical protein